MVVDRLTDFVLHVRCRAGADITGCIDDALKLSEERGMPVHFTHNDITLVVDHQTMVRAYRNQVYNAWQAQCPEGRP